MGFWKNVEEERIYQGLTRKELAFRANIAYQGIGLGIERDSMPGVDTAVKIARVLNVSLEYLLKDVDLTTNLPAQDSESFLEESVQSQANLYLKNRALIEAFESMPPQIQTPIKDMIIRIGKN
jgi:transcriptional regulator with XRE-family HTH domain